jgi:chemotaxis protein histidine kinase CheA
LAIVDAEVTTAGGTVTISTSPSGGARFTIEIPVLSSTEADGVQSSPSRVV